MRRVKRIVIFFSFFETIYNNRCRHPRFYNRIKIKKKKIPGIRNAYLLENNIYVHIQIF